MARDDASESRQVQRQASDSAGAPRESSTREGRLSTVAGAPAAAPKKSEDTEQMRQAIAQLERENRRLRKRCEEAELEINHLERSLKNTENTLSFRLGYALIHSTKSLDALRALPSALLELSRDSRRRRGSQSRAHVVLGALRASAHALDPRARKPAKDATAKKPRSESEP